MKRYVWFLMVLLCCHAMAQQASLETADDRYIWPLENFSSLHPIYFIFGTDMPSNTFEYKNQVKFNVGFKYHILRFHIFDLYTTYSQLSFWNLYDIEMSNPFWDNNYSVSPAMITFKVINLFRIPFEVSVFPWLHESNGALQEVSRGWDRIVGSILIGNKKDSPVFFSMSLWYPLKKEESNKDIADYYGYGLFELNIQPFVSFGYGIDDIGASIKWKALAFKNMFNIELSLYLNIFDLIWHKEKKDNDPWTFSPTFMVQLYHGRGENLIDYNKQHFSIRFGVVAIE
jgi:phospholipase A1